MIGRLLGRLVTGIRVVRNGIEYPMRGAMRIRRPIDQVIPAGLASALEELGADTRSRAHDLIHRFSLTDLVNRGRRHDILENLYYLELLIHAFDRGHVTLPRSQLEAIDVGVSDWFYAPALSAALQHWQPAFMQTVDSPSAARQVRALGFEADPNRLHADGHSRADWADWYTRELPGLSYLPTDFRLWAGTADVATMFFPFVFATDSDRWGLPRSLFHPTDLLQHVLDQLRPGGVLVIANQGENEADAQRAMLRSLRAEPVYSDRFESPFWSYELPRYVHAVIKR